MQPYFCLWLVFAASMALWHCSGRDQTPNKHSAPSDQYRSLVRECDTAPSQWIWCDDFEVDRSSAYFEGSMASALGQGLGGSTAAMGTFSAGKTGGGGLKIAFGRTPHAYFSPVDAGSTDYREIYWRLFLRHPRDWQGAGADKLSRLTIMASPDWAQAMIAHIWSGADPGPQAVFLGMDPASGTDENGVLQTTGYNDFDHLRWLGWKVGTKAIFAADQLGTWHCIEAQVRLNEPGALNGIFRLWVDDNLQAEHQALNWVGTYDSYGLNALFIENFWNNTSPVNQNRYFDNVVVSSARIGCGHPKPNP